MKIIINLKDFFQFLMDYKILHPYMRYLKKNNEWRKNNTIIDNESTFLKTYIIEDTSREFIILHAFPWGKTYEGYNFWANIHDKWITYIQNIKLAEIYKLAHMSRIEDLKEYI